MICGLNLLTYLLTVTFTPIKQDLLRSLGESGCLSNLYLLSLCVKQQVAVNLDGWLCQWLFRQLLNVLREGALTTDSGKEFHESITLLLKLCCLTFNRALGLNSLREWPRVAP